MAKTQDPAPSGKLVLVNYFHETSSTHADTSRDVVLVPHGAASVLMEVAFEHNNVYQPQGPGTVEKWVIEREVLIKLIKEHGSKTR